ncbi:MAG: DUF4124 domain-containing protein [Bacteroidota bacterium]
MNKQKVHLIIIAILSLIMSSNCLAQIYSWIDEDGVKHFSNTPVIIEDKVDVSIQDENKQSPKKSWRMYISNCEKGQDFDSLIKALKHEKLIIRKCAIQGLALYGDKRACDVLTDLFMSSTDGGLRTRAREAIETLNCQNNKKSSAKYQIDENYCSLCQSLIDMISPMIPKIDNIAELQDSLDFKQIDPKSMGKDVDMELLAIYFLVSEWAEKAIAYRRSEMKNQIVLQRSGDVTQLMALKDKKARLLQFCPNLNIPDYGESLY